MTRLFICNNITVDIEADGPVLGAALEHEKAESVVRCAILMALSSLAEGGLWPAAALEDMAIFMAQMKDAVHTAQLM